jgi:arginase
MFGLKLKVLGLPIYTLAKYIGMAEGVGEIRKAGLLQALRMRLDGVEDAGDVLLVKINEDTGPSNLYNLETFNHASEEIAKAVGRVEDEEARFLFLGGECSLIVGAAAGLQRIRRRTLGLLWLDSHGDFNTPETTPSGFIGGMCLAMACGRGPELASVLEAQRPSVEAANVVHACSRNLDAMERVAMFGSGMRLLEMVDLRRNGVVAALRKAIGSLEDSSDEIILHVDIDCTDPGEVPAVSFPEAGGLSLLELREVLGLAVGSERLKVVDLAAYNARRDVEGVSARRIVETVSEGLGG